MPRPTPAQIAYGSATVVFSTLVMLLLSQERSGFGAAVVALTALVLGLLAAFAVAAPPRRRHTRTAVRIPGQRTPPQTAAAPTVSESLHG
ncbi:hypothetical protein AB0A70_11260 [Streptomyces morookaense]|uniref:hypothetical protein n=1 Tax=Streptomyces morookaense TaxID=1970 RepID=UPI0033C7891C